MPITGTITTIPDTFMDPTAIASMIMTIITGMIMITITRPKAKAVARQPNSA